MLVHGVEESNLVAFHDEGERWVLAIGERYRLERNGISIRPGCLGWLYWAGPQEGLQLLLYWQTDPGLPGYSIRLPGTPAPSAHIGRAATWEILQARRNDVRTHGNSSLVGRLKLYGEPVYVLRNILHLGYYPACLCGVFSSRALLYPKHRPFVCNPTSEVT